MSTIVVISYLRPESGDVHFNEDYYLTKHMPLVTKTWEPCGLVSWEAAKMDDEPSSPYYYQVKTIWESLKGFEKASTELGASVFADVPNFTNLKVQVVKGQVRDSWQK